MDLEYVKQVSAWDSGGGIILDLVELKDGRVLAISDEVMILYKNIEDLTTGEPSSTRPSLPLL